MTMPSLAGTIEVTYDHEDLNRCVATVRSELAGLQRRGARSADFAPALGELRERMWSHFAREERDLIPFLAEVHPRSRGAIDAMVSSHATLCAAFARMCDRAMEDDPLALMVAMFERFAIAFVDHSREEMELLTVVGAELCEDDQARLGVLLEEL